MKIRIGKNFANYIIFCLIGLVGGFAFPSSFGLSCGLRIFFGMLFFSYLFIVIDKANSVKQVFFRSWALCFLSYLIAFSWVMQPFSFVGDGFEYIEKVAPLALILFSFGLSLFYGVVGILTFKIKGEWRYFAFAFFVFLMEWVRGWIFTGFPWNNVSLIFSDCLPLIQILSVIGADLFGFFMVIVLGLGALFILKSKIKWCVSIVSGLILVVFFGFGWFRVYNYNELSTGVKFRLVNAAISQKDKYNIKNVMEYLKLSRENRDGIDIFVWGETALVNDITNDEFALFQVASLNGETSNLIAGFNRVQFLGAGDYNIFNSMALIDTLGVVDLYDKEHLVPFGEYMPFKRWLPFKKFTYGVKDFSSGERGEPFFAHGLLLYPIICYEGIFSPLSISDEVDAIINISNDGWFSKSGKIQHNQMVKFRAIEEGVPVIRVSNEGISAIYNVVGDVVGGMVLDNKGVLDVELPTRIGWTFYSKYSKLLVILFISLGFFIMACYCKILIIRSKHIE